MSVWYLFGSLIDHTVKSNDCKSIVNLTDAYANNVFIYLRFKNCKSDGKGLPVYRYSI